MKSKILLLLFFFLNTILVAQTFDLEVVGAYGGGTYNKGDTIFIWANPEFQNLSFEGWQGTGTEFMLEENEWLTRIVVPITANVNDMNLEAIFNDLSSIVSQGSESILLPSKDDGEYLTSLVDVYYQIPNNPIGIIFCYHGTGGSGAGFENDFEKKSFFKAGANRGYIMIATEANEKTNGDQDGNNALRWEINNPLTDAENNNIDIRRIKVLRDTLINRLDLPTDFPTFGLGVSNGANFADLCAAALNFNASGHMTGNGFYDIYAYRTDATPVVFVQSVNDQNSSANPSAVINNYNALVDRGISSIFYWHKKTPVYPYRFVRTTDMLISPSISNQIFQRMLDVDLLLDENHQLLIDHNDELPDDLFDNLNLSTASITDCKNQIKIMNADHKFHSHYNNRILDFFDLHLSSTVALPQMETRSMHIDVFPNPTTDVFYLKGINDNSILQIISNLGEIVLQRVGCTVIDVSTLPKGMYYIKILNKDQQLTRTVQIN